MSGGVYEVVDQPGEEFHREDEGRKPPKTESKLSENRRKRTEVFNSTQPSTDYLVRNVAPTVPRTSLTDGSLNGADRLSRKGSSVASGPSVETVFLVKQIEFTCDVSPSP